MSSHGSIGDRKKHSQPESLDVARESRSRQREPERNPKQTNRGQWSNGLGGWITPFKVLQMYKHVLSPFEGIEILTFNKIYFIGGERVVKIPGTNPILPNRGYDDINGSYQIVTHDHIGYRYEVLRVLGRGAFGQVLKAFDHKMQEYVAIKVVRNNEKFRKQALSEVNILDHLLREDPDNMNNVVHMKDSFMFRTHACIVFELLSHNLYDEIKRNQFRGFGLRSVRAFAHSIVVALNTFDRMKLIHGDLKPENIVLKSAGRTSLKVLLFKNFCVYDGAFQGD